MTATETGTPDGKTGKSRCQINHRPDVEDIDAELLAHTPLVQIVSQHPGTSKSALHRHLKKCLKNSIVRAVVRATPPPPDLHEVEVYEDKILAEMLSVHAVAYEELEAARKGPDKRLVVVLLGLIRENIAQLCKFLPVREVGAEPVKIRFTFPKSAAPYRLVMPEPELPLPVAGATLDTAPSRPEVEVVAPEAEQPAPAMLGPIDVTLGRFR